MKKLLLSLFALSGLFLLTGCSLNKITIKNEESPKTITSEQTGINTPEDTLTTEENNTTIPEFDAHKIQLITQGIDTWHQYNLNEYSGGMISIELGGNDGLTVSMHYKKGNYNQRRDIFRWGMKSDATVNNIQIVKSEYLKNRARCLTAKCDQQDIGKIREIKVNCNKGDNSQTTEIIDDCIAKIFEYSYNLRAGKEHNDYFDQEYKLFLQSIK